MLRPLAEPIVTSGARALSELMPTTGVRALSTAVKPEVLNKLAIKTDSGGSAETDALPTSGAGLRFSKTAGSSDSETINLGPTPAEIAQTKLGSLTSKRLEVAINLEADVTLSDVMGMVVVASVIQNCRTGVTLDSQQSGEPESPTDRDIPALETPTPVSSDAVSGTAKVFTFAMSAQVSIASSDGASESAGTSASVSGSSIDHILFEEDHTKLSTGRQTISMKGIVDEQSALAALKGTELEKFNFTKAVVHKSGMVFYGDPVQHEYSKVFPIILTAEGAQIHPGDTISGPFRSSVGSNIQAIFDVTGYVKTSNHGVKPYPNYNLLNASNEEIAALPSVYLEGTTEADSAETFWHGINQGWSDSAKLSGRPIVYLNEYTDDLSVRAHRKTGKEVASGYLKEARDYAQSGHVHHTASRTVVSGHQVRRAMKDGEFLSQTKFRDGSRIFTLQKPGSLKGKELVITTPAAGKSADKQEETVIRFGKQFTKAEAEKIDAYVKSKF